MARLRPATDAGSGILSYFTRHATVANLLLVVLLALGIATYPRMRAQFFPDIVVNTVTVSVTWQGAGAEDVDEAIVEVLEPTLLTVEGVESTSSRSSEGLARITLDFEPGWDMARAQDDVQVAVDGSVANLPENAEEPKVRRGNWRDPVTDVVITGPVGVDQLARFADELVAILFQQGVTRTTIRGVAAPETVVEVPALALMRNNVTMEQIAKAIAEEAASDPAGDVASGAARVRTGVAKRSADAIEAIALRTNPDGSKLTIGDVARVSVEGVDRERAYFVGPDPAISINVARTAQGDAVEMQHDVEAAAESLLRRLPEGVSIDLINTRAEMISGRLNILVDNGLTGLALVVGLLFLFLNARTAFWVAAGIPVSMLTALALMHWAGITLNMISLFALILTLGIVVDDAIVVGEHADFRARRRGEGPVEAAENAARRMWHPVLSSSLTTIIAFFSLAMIGGRFGDLIFDIPFTVVAVLTASLVECFLILPNHMAHALAHSAKTHWYDWPSRLVNTGFDWLRETLFRPFIRAVIWARYPVLAATILLFAAQAALFVRGDLPFRFFNAPERGTITANFAMAPGATRADTLDMMHRLQEAVDAFGEEVAARDGRNPIDYVIAQIGGTAGRGLAGAETKEPELLGAITIELIDPDLRKASSFELVGEMQQAMPSHPLLETLSFRGGRFGPGGDALDVELTGASSRALKQAAEALKRELGQFGEVSALEDSLAYDKEELVLELTPQGEALGFTIDGLGRVLRNRLGGIEAASYPDGLRSATIRVELPAGELTADFLDRMLLPSPSGAYVSLADIVTVTSRTGFSTVNRENGLRLVSVTGDIDESDPARAEEISRTIEESILPALAETHGITYRLAGLNEQQDEFLADARTGFILGLIGIYLTLAWIFASWTRPLVVMAVIPFGLIGAIWGHDAWGVPLSMFSVVGLIGMTGIIINDSIVLVSTIDEYAESRGLIPAIIDGVVDRLRPVMLTTATTVLGLMPLLYESSSQAQFLKPTVITLVYGLGFGMVLVLLLVPTLMAMQRDVGARLHALRRGLRLGRRAPGTLALLGLAGALMLATFGATLGWTLVTGALPAYASVLPLPAIAGALALFLAGTLAIVVLTGLLALLTRPRRRPASRPIAGS